MFKDSTIQLYGNDRYEGFAIDMVEQLARLLGFSYEFLIQENNNYGDTKDNVTWDGMIGEILANVNFILCLSIILYREKIRKSS